jgi:heat shock protein HslJ
MTFRLVSLSAGDAELTLPPVPAITLRFEDQGKVNGKAAVNLYLGSLRLSPEGEIIWGADGLAVTRRSGPPALMELESIYLQALERTTMLTYDAPRLTLASTDPAFSLVFEAQSATQSVSEFYGQTLTLTRMVSGGQNMALPAKPLLSITLREEGVCAGFSGVNRYFGKLVIAAEGGVTAGPFGSTMMAGPQELMRLESVFHQTLATAKRVQVSGNSLHFADDAGNVILVFERRDR